MWPEHEGDAEIDWEMLVDYPDGTETPQARTRVHRVSPGIDTGSPSMAPSALADQLVQASLDNRTAWRAAAPSSWRDWYDGLPGAQQDAAWDGSKRWAAELVSAGFGAPS